MDERPALVTIPTELERQDAFVDGAALAATVLAAWWLTLQGLGWWSAPLVVLVSVWTLTGEPAADTPYLGAIASGLRSKLGLRRAHEWIFAWAHYFRIAVWPVWKERYARESARGVRAARSMGRRLLETTRRARAYPVRLRRADAADHRDIDVLEGPAS